MIYGLGMQELLVILAIAMLLFGGKKLPEVGKNLGKAIRGFKQAEAETTKELREATMSPKTAEPPEKEGPAEAGPPGEGAAETEPAEKPA